VWHVDYRILKAYFDYELMFKKKDNQKWMKLYSLQDYILLLQILQKAKNTVEEIISFDFKKELQKIPREPLWDYFKAFQKT